MSTCPEVSPLTPTGDAVERLFQIHKTLMDWLSGLPQPVHYSMMSLGLVYCSTNETKTALLLLNLTSTKALTAWPL